MHFLLKTGVIVLVVLGGCATQTSQRGAHAPSDTIVEQLVSFSPIQGHWTGAAFAGQFDNLRFTRLPGRRNGLIVCHISGQGELWTTEGPIPFTVTGRSIGETLFPILEVSGQQIQGEGTVTRDELGLPACRMKFRYNGVLHEASLDCVSDREQARKKFLDAQRLATIGRSGDTR